MQSLKTYINAKSQNILSFVSFWEHKFEAIQGLSSALFSLLNSFSLQNWDRGIQGAESGVYNQ